MVYERRSQPRDAIFDSTSVSQDIKLKSASYMALKNKAMRQLAVKADEITVR